MTLNSLNPAAAPQRRPLSPGGGLARFGRDKTGAAALEFALIAMPFLGLVVCIIEVAIDFLLFSQIDYATHKAAMEIRSGNVQANKMTVEQFKTDVLCPKLSGMSCSSIQVSTAVVKNYWEWFPWSPYNPNPAQKWCTGGATDVVVLRVSYPVPLATMIWAGTASANGNRYYVSSAAFRNDPFGLPSGTC